MKTHKLMIKTHVKTGLKYLCYTRSEGITYSKYKGSGKLWKSHLKKYGDEILTELIFETNNIDEFKKISIEKSIEFDIVNSSDWANLKIEAGDGGDTVSMKRWITDGIVDKYFDKNLELPEGWIYGRSNCVFNDSSKQIEFATCATTEARRNGMKSAWDSGKMDHRDHSKCGLKGDQNVSKRPDVAAKISEAKKKNCKVTSEQMKETWKRFSYDVECPHCNKVGNVILMHRWHFDNCKHKEIHE